MSDMMDESNEIIIFFPYVKWEFSLREPSLIYQTDPTLITLLFVVISRECGHTWHVPYTIIYTPSLF